MEALTRLPPDYDPGVRTLSRDAGEGLGRIQLKVPFLRRFGYDH